MPLLFGNDGNSDMRALLVDNEGRPLIAAKVDASTTRPVLCDLSGRLYAVGNQGNVLHGYRNNYVKRSSNTNIGTGTTNLDDTACPAEYIKVITHFAYKYFGTVATVQLVVSVVSGAQLCTLAYISPPVSNGWYPVKCEAYLKENDFLRLTAYNGTAGDDIFLDVHGYYTSVN